MNTLLKKSSILMILALGLAACNDDSDPVMKNDDNTNQRSARFEATDAPIDDAEVDAVFVTVSEIWVDGEKVEGFNKTTIELSAMTEGKTEILSDTNFEKESFNEVTLVLDYETDASGNAPGSYVLKADGTKDQIKSSDQKITMMKQVDLDANARTDVVFDFDLRKMIKEESKGDYEFVTDSEMEASMRAVVKAESGQISGNVDDKNKLMDDKAVIYLYKKGTYSSSEMNGSGTSSITFKNAVSSSTVDSTGKFHLAFIEDGEYELYLYNYNDSDKDGRYEISGMTQLMINGETSFSGSDLKNNTQMNLDLTLTAILPL